MEEHTVSPGGNSLNGRIIVAVTILGSHGQADAAGASRADVLERVVELPAGCLDAGSAESLQELLGRALLRAGRLPPPRALGNNPAGEPSDWERLIEVRLRSRSQDLYAEALTVMERQLLTRVLNHAAGNQSLAARILGITRGCLRAKIRTLGITIGHSVRSEYDHLDRRAATDDPRDMGE